MAGPDADADECVAQDAERVPHVLADAPLGHAEFLGGIAVGDPVFMDEEHHLAPAPWHRGDHPLEDLGHARVALRRVGLDDGLLLRADGGDLDLVLVPVELAAPVLLPGAVLLLPELPRVGDPVEAPKPAEPGLSPDPQANKTIRAK